MSNGAPTYSPHSSPPTALDGARLDDDSHRMLRFLYRRPITWRSSPMKWVTRKNANVDRVACPWLIRRFVDQDAEFLYVPADEVVAVAERESAIPYDVKGVELGHVDGRCSFESIMVKYGLDDPGLGLLARIVH